jgi:hypothetical protein
MHLARVGTTTAGQTIAASRQIENGITILLPTIANGCQAKGQGQGHGWQTSPRCDGQQ